MKYLRALIVILILMLIGIGVYYGYTKINSSKKSNPSYSVETPRPFQELVAGDKNKVVSKYSEYSTQDSRNSGKPIIIQGNFQAFDNQEKTINGVAYNYLIGIVGSDEKLSRTWLTSAEYQQISSIVPKNVRAGEPVTLILSGSVVNFSTPFETTNN